MVATLSEYCKDKGMDFMLERPSDVRLVLENHACNWDLELAKEHVEKLDGWNADVAPGDILLDDVAPELEQNKVYWAGTDVHGHPTLWFLLRNHRPNPDGPDRDVRAVIFMLHQGLQRMRLPVEKFNLVFDLSNAARANQDLTFFKRVISAVGSAWPGRSFKIFILSPGFFTRMIWNVVKPFLPARTLERIKFVKNPDPALQHWFAPDQLLARYGGSVTNVYDYTTAAATDFPIGLDLSPPPASPKLAARAPALAVSPSNASTCLSDWTDDSCEPQSEYDEPSSYSPSPPAEHRHSPTAHDLAVSRRLERLAHATDNSSRALDEAETELAAVRKRLADFERTLDERESRAADGGCCSLM
ncbi:polyphosphoinositide binding protein Ssh2p [Thecamonas trahens ATCC 50062]|uniref:Polyphosphoinositide binding protein Ssh2p n=1 Tax=Thecamonas trahens ATCC 50062 TaxID=461836 RepID=A0A0L0D1H1_THETB|nr:polyphosphoinositide binding protein Ssh2p [Thecamonas trahens ATCC 50062]KNC46209.1 polyphosphoinositide binding protein Ssh2p [Thecamonas trahens ATCC 50062]|eukprot:XP_013760506.1 polyphosphoinositide binding protein Ssh2p [Thecamonas trahens ATCC 50062]